MRAARDSDTDARPPQAVRLVPVEASTAAESTTYSAITPNAQIDLAFRVSGYVVDVRRTKGADGRTRAVEPGAAVTTGLVLARIRATIIRPSSTGRRAHTTNRVPVSTAEAALAEARGIHTSGI